MQPIKSGHESTEFKYLNRIAKGCTALGFVGLGYSGAGVWCEHLLWPGVALLAAAGLTLGITFVGYAFSRGLAKAGYGHAAHQRINRNL